MVGSSSPQNCEFMPSTRRSLLALRQRTNLQGMFVILEVTNGLPDRSPVNIRPRPRSLEPRRSGGAPQRRSR